MVMLPSGTEQERDQLNKIRCAEVLGGELIDLAFDAVARTGRRRCRLTAGFFVVTLLGKGECHGPDVLFFPCGDWGWEGAIGPREKWLVHNDGGQVVSQCFYLLDHLGQRFVQGIAKRRRAKDFEIEVWEVTLQGVESIGGGEIVGGQKVLR